MTIPDFENSELEKLAQMVARGFEAIDERFDTLKEEMDERFNKVDERFNGVDQQLAEIRVEIRQIRERLESLEEKHIPLAEQDELWQRVRRIEDKLGLPHELAVAQPTDDRHSSLGRTPRPSLFISP